MDRTQKTCSRRSRGGHIANWITGETAQQSVTIIFGTRLKYLSDTTQVFQNKRLGRYPQGDTSKSVGSLLVPWPPPVAEAVDCLVTVVVYSFSIFLHAPSLHDLPPPYYSTVYCGVIIRLYYRRLKRIYAVSLGQVCRGCRRLMAVRGW